MPAAASPQKPSGSASERARTASNTEEVGGFGAAGIARAAALAVGADLRAADCWDLRTVTLRRFVTLRAFALRRAADLAAPRLAFGLVRTLGRLAALRAGFRRGAARLDEVRAIDASRPAPSHRLLRCILRKPRGNAKPSGPPSRGSPWPDIRPPP